MCVQGDMAEALKTIDSGLAAAGPELGAYLSEADRSQYPVLEALRGSDPRAEASHQPSSAAVKGCDSHSGDAGRLPAGTEQRTASPVDLPGPANHNNPEGLQRDCQAFAACLESFLVRCAAATSLLNPCPNVP